jgi:hypothetical protein
MADPDADCGSSYFSVQRAVELLRGYPDVAGRVGTDAKLTEEPGTLR